MDACRGKEPVMAGASPDPTRPRTIREDLDKAKGDITIAGVLVAAAVLLLPAGAGTVIGLDDAADPFKLFISVLLFTLPLSLCVAIWAIALLVIDERSWNPYKVVAWSLLVAFGALALAGALGGPRIVVDYSGLPAGPPGFITAVFRVLDGFRGAYGDGVFVGSLIVGGTLVWLYGQYVHHRLTGNP
jgi:hypothetical protein